MKYVALLVLVLVVAAGGLTLAHRRAYGNFPWDGGPDRVQWCERSYHRSPEDKGLRDNLRLQPIFRALPLVGDRFYARRSANCAERPELLLYRGKGDGEYNVYALTGGP